MGDPIQELKDELGKLTTRLAKVESNAADKVRVERLEQADIGLRASIDHLEDAFGLDRVKLDGIGLKLEGALARFEGSLVKGEVAGVDVGASLVKGEFALIDINEKILEAKKQAPWQLDLKIAAAKARADEAFAKASREAPQRAPAGPAERAGAQVDSGVRQIRAGVVQVRQAVAQVLGFRTSAQRASLEARRAADNLGTAAAGGARGVRDLTQELGRAKRAMES